MSSYHVLLVLFKYFPNYYNYNSAGGQSMLTGSLGSLETSTLPQLHRFSTVTIL